MTRHKLKPHEIDLPSAASVSRLTALLGPTNTGKTYFAIERLLSHPSGMIGLPLRLLAREVYDRLVERRGAGEVALVTGEEKITPPRARYIVATVEAMPLSERTEFLAIDEVQLAADPERGRVFTSRLIHARGAKETLFLGSDTMRPILKRLFPEIAFETKERFSTLAYTGSKKVTRLPRRSAIVGFSADTVYAIAELVRRQRGGAAVVLGALSPRTRNAQAELYQSGEVDYLVATDAIGMGLNMDIDHVAFAAARKFDGRGFRDLRAAELAQVAGRAGRHIRDGAFGVTADCRPFDEEIVEAIENHRFDPIEALQWRSDALDFSSLAALTASLSAPSPRPDLHRARPDDDELALAAFAADESLAARIRGRAACELLWEVCQIPDFRKVSFDHHMTLIREIHQKIEGGGRIDDDWLAARVEKLADTAGDFDSLSARIAHIRSWTYLSNRSQWIASPGYWQGRTREIEDRLSDALHEKLTQRFVDRRTSVLLKKLRDEAPILAGVNDDGEVIVEGQFVGRLIGFEFIVDPRAHESGANLSGAVGADAKRLRGAAERAIAPLLAARAAALATASEGELKLHDDGVVWWRSSPVAELRKGPAILRPDVVIKGLDAISPNLRGRVADRLTAFVAARIETPLAELIALKRAIDATDDKALSGQARGIAFRLFENFGAISRSQFGDELKSLGQEDRSRLRNLGVRFGEYTLHMPSLLKPAAARLMAMLWALSNGRALDAQTLPKPGLVSFVNNQELPHAYYYALGYRPSGDRAVRIDMLERLAQQIRSARNNADREGFEASSQMMSLVGCSGEEFESILRSLGYRKQMVKRPLNPPIVAGSTPVESTPAESLHVEAAPLEGQAPTAPETAAEPINDAPVEIAAEAPVEPSAENISQAPAETALAEAAQAETAATGETAPSAEPEMIEVALWRMAPRRPPQPRRAPRRDDKDASGAADAEKDARGGRGNFADKNRRDKNQRSGAREGNRDGTRDGNRDRGDRRHGKKPFNKGADAPPRQYSSAPRRERGPDPNSPFAVLAALKAGMTSEPTSE